MWFVGKTIKKNCFWQSSVRFYHIIKPQYSTKVLKQNVHMVVLTQSELYRQITLIPAHLSNEKCQQKRTANSTMHSSSLINITCIGSNHPHFQNFQGKKNVCWYFRSGYFLVVLRINAILWKNRKRYYLVMQVFRFSKSSLGISLSAWDWRLTCLWASVVHAFLYGRISSEP